MYMNIKVFFLRNMKISVVKETNVTQNNMKLSAAHLNIHTLMFDIISIVGFCVFFLSCNMLITFSYPLLFSLVMKVNSDKLPLGFFRNLF